MRDTSTGAVGAEHAGASGRSELAARVAFVVIVLALALLGWQFSGLRQRLATVEAKFAQAEARLQQAETRLATGEAREAAVGAERDALARTPGRYIESTDVQITIRGLFTSYSHATAAVLRNTSRFNVADIRGLVEYHAADGALVGSSPVTVQGTVLAGQTLVLPISTGEVTGKADGSRSRILVEHVTVLDGR